jgi:hypothetical protein
MDPARTRDLLREIVANPANRRAIKAWKNPLPPKKLFRPA